MQQLQQLSISKASKRPRLDSIQNSSNFCLQCRLKFDSITQLLNHRRKFCLNSGYDKLTGLLMKQTTKNDLNFNNITKDKQNDFKLQNSNQKIKNYGLFSLTKIKPSSECVVKKKSLAFCQELKGLSIQKDNFQQIKNDQDGSMTKKSVRKIDQIEKKNIKQSKFNELGNLKSASLFAYRLNESEFGKKLNSKTEQLQNILLRDQAYISSLNRSTIKNNDFKLRQLEQKFSSYYTSNPATQQFKPVNLQKYPSILQKSDASIQNMTENQKLTYAMYKLGQLNQIKKSYFQNGGQSLEFKKTIQNMISFYNKLLNDSKHNNLDSSSFSKASRPETPIMKLKRIWTKQKQIENINKQAEKQQYSSRNKPNPTNLMYNIPHQIQPNIHILPNYDSNRIIQQAYYLKMMQNTIKTTQEQNKKLVEALINKKASQQNVKQMETKLTQEEKYRFSKQVDITTASQDRILKLLQQQQLDELKLISKLPINLQDQKLQSVMKNSQLRFKMQKQVLRQKLQRLCWQEKCQSFEQYRQLRNHQWIGSKKKDVVKTKINDYMIGLNQQLKPN